MFALKICAKSWVSNCDDQLNFCNLPKLVHRRRSLKLTFLYQVLHGNFSFPVAPLERRPMPFNVINFNIVQTNSSHQHLSMFVFPHTITLWNSLPSIVHTSTSLYCFKCAISKLNL